MLESIRYYTPDKQFHSDHGRPEFWLNGEYRQFETDTVSALPIGDAFIKWIWNAGNHDPYMLAQELCSIVLVPKNAEPIELMKHAMDRPREMFFMRGTIGYCARLPKRHAYHLSVKAREQMAAFASVHPYLADALRHEARSDFVSRLNTLLTPEQLRVYGRMPGYMFTYFESLFPWLVDVVYQSIEREDGDVVSYGIRPLSEEFLQYLRDQNI